MCVFLTYLFFRDKFAEKCPWNVVKSDTTHFGDVLKGKIIYIYIHTTLQKFTVCKFFFIIYLFTFFKIIVLFIKDALN